MTLSNITVAELLDEIADLLAIKGENPFRTRAYRNAARLVRGMKEPLESILQNPNRHLSDLPGIGKDLETKITKLAQTGKIELLDQLRRAIPNQIRDLLRVQGLGPKRAQQLFTQLGVNSLASLREAAKAHQIAALPGFGPQLESNILRSLDFVAIGTGRVLLSKAHHLAQQLTTFLRNNEIHCSRNPTAQDRLFAVAGSYRRRKETIGDLDLVAAGYDPDKLMDRLAQFEGVATTEARGPTRMTVRLRDGFQIDLRVVPEGSWGAALLYFTGSKSHNIELRQLAQSRGLKLNEYGLFEGERQIAGRHEEDIYAALGLAYIPPELRESKNEIAAAMKNQLPRLVKTEDIIGDLHMHTNATDGTGTLVDMIEGSLAKGYHYIAITDHSKRSSIAHGLTAKALQTQWQEIDRIRSQYPDIEILKGVELDVLNDGSLDMPDDILEQADWVIAAIHYDLMQTRAALTKRMVSAVKHPLVSALAHPTSRLIGERPSINADFTTIFKAAADFGCALEINGQPQRLDLNEAHLELADKYKPYFVLGSDAHSVADLDYMTFAMWQARRGALDPNRLINTQKWPRALDSKHQPTGGFLQT